MPNTIAMKPAIQIAVRNACCRIAPMRSWRVAAYTRLTDTISGKANHIRLIETASSRRWNMAGRQADRRRATGGMGPTGKDARFYAVGGPLGSFLAAG